MAGKRYDNEYYQEKGKPANAPRGPMFVYSQSAGDCQIDEHGNLQIGMTKTYLRNYDGDHCPASHAEWCQGVELEPGVPLGKQVR